MKKVLPFLRRLIYCSGSVAPPELQRYKVTKEGLRASGLRVDQPREKRKKVCSSVLCRLRQFLCGDRSAAGDL